MWGCDTLRFGYFLVALTALVLAALLPSRARAGDLGERWAGHVLGSPQEPGSG